METWRRFLKEGPSDDIESFYGDDYDPSQAKDENSIDEPLPGEAPFEEEKPVPVDGMSDDNNDPFDDEYNPEGMDSLHNIGDPAKMGRGSSAPMLDAPDDDDMMYDTDDSEYVTDNDSLNPDIAYDSGSFDDSLDRMP